MLIASVRLWPNSDVRVPDIPGVNGPVSRAAELDADVQLRYRISLGQSLPLDPSDVCRSPSAIHRFGDANARIPP
jgi:hypothetical protein